MWQHLQDDCTRLTYAGIIADKRSSTLTYFMARGLSWFKQIYNFEYEAVMSDNGPEFRGSLDREHPFETLCHEIGIKTLFNQTLSATDQWKSRSVLENIKEGIFLSQFFRFK